MEISGGSGQWDCKGWSHLNRVWNILPYLMLVFLGGICSWLRRTVWSCGGAFSAVFACALHGNHLHPLPPAPLPHSSSLSAAVFGMPVTAAQRLLHVWETSQGWRLQIPCSIPWQPGYRSGFKQPWVCCQSACSRFLRENGKIFVWFENK